ncbi:MAG: hypothetical protein IPL67_10485 [Ignavibacteria bacterium]|nr:hypothetical protein [Ignavibacteria bacterium]
MYKKKKRLDVIKAFLYSIASYQIENGKRTILEQAISTSFKADPDLVKIVLKYTELKQLSAGGSSLLSTILLSDTLIDTDPLHVVPVLPVISDTATLKDHYSSIRLLNKLLPLISSFKLSLEEIKWYFKNNKNLGWFEWDSIPYKSGGSPADFDKYMAFIAMLDLAKQFPPVINPADAEDPISF